MSPSTIRLPCSLFNKGSPNVSSPRKKGKNHCRERGRIEHETVPRVPLPSGIQASFTWTYPPPLPVVNLSSVGARQKLVRTITCPCDSYVATRDSFFGPHDTRHRALVPSYSPSPDGPDCGVCRAPARIKSMPALCRAGCCEPSASLCRDVLSPVRARVCLFSAAFVP